MAENLNNNNILKEYISAEIYSGHFSKNLNEKMSPYIYNQKNGYLNFDLIKTSKLLAIAGNVVKTVAQNNGKFLFVNTNSNIKIDLESYAKRVNGYYINNRWPGGLLTNWSTMASQIENLNNLEAMNDYLCIKNLSSKNKKILTSKCLFKGIKNMRSLPDIVIFTSQLKNSLAINECLKLSIPTVSIVDSNSNPSLISYPIPGNDDSEYSINYILNYLTNKIINK